MYNGNQLYSESFKSVNGVRQGGILSPLLFSVYVDELSVNLCSVPYGCYINSVCTNHIMYADDTVLIAPSPAALQKLIDLARAFFTANGLVIKTRRQNVWL